MSRSLKETDNERRARQARESSAEKIKNLEEFLQKNTSKDVHKRLAQEMEQSPERLAYVLNILKGGFM